MNSRIVSADECIFYTREQAEELFDIYCTDDEAFHESGLYAAIKTEDGMVHIDWCSHDSLRRELDFGTQNATEGYARLLN